MPGPISSAPTGAPAASPQAASAMRGQTVGLIRKFCPRDFLKEKPASSSSDRMVRGSERLPEKGCFSVGGVILASSFRLDRKQAKPADFLKNIEVSRPVQNLAAYRRSRHTYSTAGAACSTRLAMRAAAPMPEPAFSATTTKA